MSMSSGYGVEPMRAVRRRGWILACYSFALLVASLVLVTAAAERGWRVYGVGCLLLCVGLGARAAAMLVQERPGLQALPGRIGGVVAQVRRGLSDALEARDAAAVRERPAGALGGLPGMAVTQSRVNRAELTKLCSVRSTMVVLGVALGFILLLGLLVTVLFAAQFDKLSPPEQAALRPAVLPLTGVSLAQLAIGVLGALAISSEYTGGMIRATMTAAPRRTPVLWGKVFALVVVVGGGCLVANVVTFLIGQAVLAKEELSISLLSGAAWTAILGATAYLVLIAVLGLALGALLRSTALSISALVAVLFLLPIVVAVLPGGISQTISPYLFGSAGQAIWSDPAGHAITSPVAAFLVTLAWPGAVLAAGAYRLLRDDV